VTVAGHFTDYTGVFMIHCHMLDHEDHGLMAQFKVVRPSSRAPRAAAVDPVSRVLTAEWRSTPTDGLPQLDPLLAALASPPRSGSRTAFSAMSRTALAKMMCGVPTNRPEPA
jgi:hypothetical protein